MLKSWILRTVIVMLLAYFLPGIFVENWFYAAIAAAGLGFLNAIVRPVLVVLTFPITLLTLGLFLLVINVIIALTASYFLPGFEILGTDTERIIRALLFSFGLTLMEWIVGIKDDD